MFYTEARRRRGKHDTRSYALAHKPSKGKLARAAGSESKHVSTMEWFDFTSAHYLGCLSCIISTSHLRRTEHMLLHNETKHLCSAWRYFPRDINNKLHRYKHWNLKLHERSILNGINLQYTVYCYT